MTQESQGFTPTSRENGTNALQAPGENEKRKERIIDEINNSIPQLALVLGMALLTLTNIFFVIARPEFLGGLDHTTVYVSLAVLLAGATSLGASGISFIWLSRRAPPKLDKKTGRVILRVKKVVSDAFLQNRRIVIAASVVYGLFFALVNAVIIYQPNVNFSQAYNVFGTFSSVVLPCCGPPGYVPVGLVYFPAQHAGLQIIPITILLMILISALVGLNVSLMYTSAKVSRASSFPARGSRSSLSGSLGALFGLFAGCPTCAAAFFISMIAGSGATAFSIFISQYQAVIAMLTIPLLLGSIYFQARSISLILNGCNV